MLGRYPVYSVQVSAQQTVSMDKWLPEVMGKGWSMGKTRSLR